MPTEPPRTATGFPDDDGDPLRGFAEMMRRLTEPMRAIREQQEAVQRLTEPMRAIREQQEAVQRLTEPMRAIRQQQDVWRLAASGGVALTGDPLSGWREQQKALRTVMPSLTRWRLDLRLALDLPVFLAPTTSVVAEDAGGVDEALDAETLHVLADYQAELIRQTVGPVVDAAADTTSNDETLLAAAVSWATSQPWRVTHYYLTVWLKALEMLTSGGTAADAVATGSAPSTPVLLVIAAIFCTAEFALLLSRPGGPEGE